MVLGVVAQAEFTVSDVHVEPGQPHVLHLTLVNLSNHTEQFTLVPSGLLAGWTRVEPPIVTLFGGSHQQIQVTLKPPQLPSTPAGPAPLTIRVIPQGEPDEVVLAETTVIIGAFHDRRLHLLQPVVRSRRRATFEFLLENQGNSQASCRLHLIDTSHRLDGDFDPPAVGVEPGANSLVRLRMKAVHRHWKGSSRTLPFAIEADQQGFPTASANATYVQTPVLPQKLGRRLVAFAAVCGLLVAAWFALAKPAVERAARDAVDEEPRVTVPVTALPGQTLPPQTTQPADNSTPTTAAAEDLGRPFQKYFTVSAGLGATQRDTFTVPDGQELRVTTMVLQNTNADVGRATFLKNDVTLATWNLDTVLPNVDPFPLGGPLVLEAGAVLAFDVTCDSVGSGTGSACVDGLFVNGALFNAT
jgi:hypothetical protein